MELSKEGMVLNFRQVQDTKRQDFAAAVEIYIESFSSNSRQSVRVLKERIDCGASRLYVGCLQQEVVSIAVLFPLEHTEFILLDYIATKKTYRSQGIGNALMREMQQWLIDKEKFLLIEVERPEPGERQEQTERRVSFYQRVGAKIMKGVRYLLPAFDGSSPVPTEMLLMIFPEYKQKTIPAKAVEEAIAQIYRELYNRDSNDPLLHAIIDDLKDPIELV